MDLKKTKISNFGIKPPKKSAFSIDTPKDIPKLHTLMIFSGKRGGGKSVAITNYLRKLLDLNLMDRILLLTPTWHSNKEIYSTLNLNEDTDVIEPSKTSLRDIILMVEAEKAEWDLFLKNKEMYKKFEKEMNGNTPIAQISPEDLMAYHDNQFFNRKPEWKYNKEVPPRIFLLIDDMLGTPLMLPSSGLTNLCIKHRHIAEGTGISIGMLVQSYCCLGGLNRAIRENSCQLALFKNTDESQIKKIIQEMGDVEEEKFMKMFEYATSEPFGFLFIDFNSKSPEQAFRKNYDEYLS